MSDVEQVVGGEWTPEARERLLALIAVNDPKCFRPLLWFLTYIPVANGTRTAKFRQRLDRYQIERAVRTYRESR